MDWRNVEYPRLTACLDNAAHRILAGSVMTDEQFDALIRRIEERFVHHKDALRWRTAGLLLLGYAGFLSWFLLVFLLGGLCYVGAVLSATELLGGLILILVGAILVTISFGQAYSTSGFGW